MFNDEINKLDFDSVQKMLLENPAELIQIISELTDRKISSGGTGVDRKLLYTWRKQKIIPFTEEIGWGRFSFIELCWIKLVVKFRDVGLSMDKIRSLKNYFFDDKFISQLFSNSTIDWSILEEETARKTKETLNIGSDNIFNPNQEILDFFTKNQISIFTLLILVTFFKRANMYLYFDSEGKTDCIDMNEIINFEDFPKILDIITEKSVVLINLRKIITEIIKSDEFFSKQPNLANLLSEKSINSIKKLFVEKKVDEVTIRFNENGGTALLKKRMKFSEFEKEINSINKKGNFKDLVIKTRDGNIQYFEQTELIKL